MWHINKYEFILIIKYLFLLLKFKNHIIFYIFYYNIYFLNFYFGNIFGIIYLTVNRLDNKIVNNLTLLCFRNKMTLILC